MDAEQQRRFEELKTKAAGPGVSAEETDELGRLYALAEEKPYSHHQTGEEVEAETAAGGSSPGESEQIDKEFNQGTFEAKEKAAPTERPAASGMLGAAFEKEEGDKDEDPSPGP
jgi:hypothetical protein